jgi:prevent-host-death family protein
MRYSKQIKPISFIKANAAEVLEELEKSREPIVITQNGEARAVLLDVRSYEESQETLALLKILSLGRRQVEAGEVHPLSQAIASIRKSLGERDERSAA